MPTITARQKLNRAIALLFCALIAPLAVHSTSPVPPPTPRHSETPSASTAQRPLQLQFNCTETFAPNVVVISGAVTAKSVRPKDGSEQIDKQLAALQAFAQSKGGRVNVLERLRAARNAETSRGERREGDNQPFLQLQKIEVELPATIDVDEAIERVLKLGIDRYGKDVRVEGYDANREFRNLTSYRIGDLAPKLSKAVDQCVEAEVKRVCGAQRAKVCLSEINWNMISVRALDVANGYGSRGDRALRFLRGGNPIGEAHGEDERLDLLSANPVRVRIQGYASVLNARGE